jgi:hypothetical protein
VQLHQILGSEHSGKVSQEHQGHRLRMRCEADDTSICRRQSEIGRLIAYLEPRLIYVQHMPQKKIDRIPLERPGPRRQVTESVLDQRYGGERGGFCAQDARTKGNRLPPTLCDQAQFVVAPPALRADQESN